MFGHRPDSPANFAQRAAVGWRLLPVPVVAALQGACYGGGAQLALAADIRIAAPDTKLSIMEAKYGIIPDMGLSQVLPGLVRDDVARELVYTARIVEAEEAAELGLVTRISDSALEDARALAEQIAAQRPEAMRSAKRLIGDWHRMPREDGLALEEELQRALISTARGRRGGELKNRNTVLILGAAQFIMVLDTTVMNVSITQVVDDLDSSVSAVQAAITLYALVMAAFMLTGAKLGDMFGRRRIFAIGLAIYGAGSLTTALSPSITVSTSAGRASRASVPCW